jgi:hypothetical protein
MKEKIIQTSSKPLTVGLWLILILYIFASSLSLAQSSDKMVIIIIDGARYSETFGDPTHTYIPKMWDLSVEGSMIDNFHNDSLTYTSRAIPALWCGTWTEVRDTFYAGHQTQYTVKPSIFEYYRKQKNMLADECFYVLKYIEGLWLPSFDPLYGFAYWPQYHSIGSTDDDVAEQAELVMNTYHPHFLWIYLADVDHAGHSGNWGDYTTAIQNADSIVAYIWEKIQSDPFYQNSTTLFVTNDHGRHDDQHGGFSGHGDGCDGCRHIMFLALGPDIKKNFISSQYRRTPDMSVTTAEILGVDPTKATGNIMTEIIEITAIKSELNLTHEFFLGENYPNPFNPSTTITFTIPFVGAYRNTPVQLKIYDVLGKEVATLVNEEKTAGSYQVQFSAKDGLPSGIYFYRIQAGKYIETKKMVLLK